MILARFGQPSPREFPTANFEAAVRKPNERTELNSGRVRGSGNFRNRLADVLFLRTAEETSKYVSQISGSKRYETHRPSVRCKPASISVGSQGHGYKATLTAPNSRMPITAR